MRRARSQLNRLMNQGMDDYGNSHNAMNRPFISNEAVEIQRRLDSMNHQNGVYQQPQHQPMAPQYNDPGMMQGNQQFMQPQAMDPYHNQAAPSQMAEPQIYQAQPQPNFQPAPAIQQAPAIQPAPAIQQAPAMQPAPTMQAAPAMQPFAEMAMHAPAPTNMANPQFDNIKKSLEQMSSKLHSMNQANTAQNTTQSNNLQQIDMLKQHYNHINNELQGIKNTISGIAIPDNSAANIDILRETLSANYRAIMQQLEQSTSQQIDSSAFTHALEASQNKLSDEIKEIKASIGEVVAKPNNADIYAKTLEVSHDDLTKRLDDMHNALQATMAQPGLYVETVERNNQTLQQQIQSLQDSLDNKKDDVPVSPEIDFSSLEMRLEEITRAVVALSLNDSGVNNLERIEARVSDVAKTLDGLNQENTPQAITEFDYSGIENLDSKLNDISKLLESSSPDLSGLSNQIDTLNAKFEDFSAVSSTKPPEYLSGLSNQITTLSEKFENFSAMSSSAAPLLSMSTEDGTDNHNALLMRMDELVDQISKNQTPITQSSDSSQVLQYLEQIAGAIDQLSTPTAQPSNIEGENDQLKSIEKQLLEINRQMSATPASVAAMPEFSLDPITDRLSGIEEQLGASRDVAIEVASKAAEDAVKMTLHSAPQFATSSGATPDNTILDSMTQLLQQISQQTETNSSQNIEALGAVSETLNVMVERIGNIENDLTAKSNHVSQAAPLISEQAPLVQQAQNVMPQSMPVEPEATIDADYDMPNGDAFEVIDEPVNAYSPASALVQAARENEQKNASLDMQAVNSMVQEPEISETLEASTIIEKLEENTGIKLPEIQSPSMEMDNVPDDNTVSNEAESLDVALEPGTGGPDLASLVRQANERRKNAKGSAADTSGTDFIAAARRAAQAAAQEAGAVEEEIEETKKSKLLSLLPNLFAKRKKVLIMAAAATLFVALAVPLAAKFMGGSEPKVAALNNDVVIEQSANTDLADNTSQGALNTEVSQQASFVQPTTSPNISPLTNSDNVGKFQDELKSANTGFSNSNINDEVKVASLNVATPEVNAQPALINVEGLNFAPAALLSAVQRGEPEALFEIGKRYTDGDGTKKDLEKAAQWYERAADLGFAPAQYIVGNFNEKGLGIDKNPEKARDWYEQAAKGGNVIAMHNLAVLHATPNALAPEPNMAEAFKWFSKAADYGVRDSQVNAGIFYTKGFGTDVNLVEAYKWFSIAGEAGDKDASNKRGLIANAITPDDLEIAKALIKDWKPLEVVKASNEVSVKDEWKSQQPVAQNLKVNRNLIAQTQQVLARLGYSAGTPDGIMGQKTRNAISAFQKQAGLPVNGKIDINLIKALQKSIGA